MTPPPPVAEPVADLVRRLQARIENAHLMFYTNFRENIALDEAAIATLSAETAARVKAEKERDEARAAARDLIAARSDTYRAGNNRRVGMQDENGEKMWLVPFDEMAALERMLEDKRLRCLTCNAPRSVSPCHKCGGELVEAHEHWTEPRLPDISRIRALAKEVGYAVGVHGSLERDLDLIAAPWTDDAVTAETLAEHIATGINGRVLSPENKPLGRWSCNIQIDGWFKLIDLSVAPTDKAEARVRELEEGLSPDVSARLTEFFETGLRSYQTVVLPNDLAKPLYDHLLRARSLLADGQPKP